jgi:hypothetical protein
MSVPEAPKHGLVSEAYGGSHNDSGSEHKHLDPNEVVAHGNDPP